VAHRWLQHGVCVKSAMFRHYDATYCLGNGAKCGQSYCCSLIGNHTTLLIGMFQWSSITVTHPKRAILHGHRVCYFQLNNFFTRAIAQLCIARLLPDTAQLEYTEGSKPAQSVDQRDRRCAVQSVRAKTKWWNPKCQKAVKN